METARWPAIGYHDYCTELSSIVPFPSGHNCRSRVRLSLTRLMTRSAALMAVEPGKSPTLEARLVPEPPVGACAIVPDRYIRIERDERNEIVLDFALILQSSQPVSKQQEANTGSEGQIERKTREIRAG